MNGNAGQDTLTFQNAAVVTSTIQGGAANDTINIATLTSGRVNGNKANDTIDITTCPAEVFGGQGNDQLDMNGGQLKCVVPSATTSSTSPLVWYSRRYHCYQQLHIVVVPATTKSTWIAVLLLVLVTSSHSPTSNSLRRW